MRNIPIEKIFPYDDNDFMIAASDTLVFGVTDIRDDAGNAFSIRNIMESRGDVFGSDGFEKRTQEFSKILFTRLERFFVTNRCDYIYFDMEEQQYLKEKIFHTHALTAKVEIYMIEDGYFVKKNFDTMGMMEYSKIRNEINSLGLIAACSPREYIMMSEKSKNYDKFNRERMKAFQVDRKLEKIFTKYHGMQDCKTHKEFNKVYKHFAKELHPDVNQDISAEEFQTFQEDIRYIKKSKWYRGLM